MNLKTYLVDKKSDLYNIKKLLDENNVLYEVETQIVLEKGEILPFKVHKAYIIKLENEKYKAIQDIFDNENEYLIEDIALKRINVNNSKTQTKVAINEVLFVVLTVISIVCFGVMIITSDTKISNVTMWISLISIIAAFLLSAQRNILAAIDLIWLMAILALGFSANYTLNHALDLLAYRGTEHVIAQYSLFGCIIIMIFVLFYIIYHGFKNYSNKKFRDKVKYCIAIGFGYFTVVVVVIYGYANLFSIYHNELYFKYSQILMDAPYKIREDSSRCFVEKREETDNGYIMVEGFYNKEYGSIEIDFLPQYIMISEYDENGDRENFKKRIEPETNLLLNSDSIGTSNVLDYTYFSVITYFTIGYGDVYPIATTVKNWIIQEVIISHILTAMIIPICLVIAQKFIEDKKI